MLEAKANPFLVFNAKYAKTAKFAKEDFNPANPRVALSNSWVDIRHWLKEEEK